MSPRRRRPPRDRPGVRRASAEFGSRATGYGSRSQAAADRRRRRAGGSAGRDSRSPWRRQADRTRSLVRFGARHKAGLLGWVGMLGILTCMWAFTGVTQALTVTVCAAGAGGGAYLRHRQRARLHHGPNVRRVGLFEQARARRDAGGGPVTVDAYTRPDGTRVDSHTRHKPGQSEQARGAA